MMKINEAIDFIESISWKGSRLGLIRIKRLLELLGHPEKGLKYIHVAGTNGKGSTCAMLSAILTKAGYNTGLYTSPHLVKYQERMRFNDKDITDEEFARAAQKVKDACDIIEDELSPTVFEVVTAMAFLYFAEKKCDIVILEVGIGGRFDATNVIDAPVLSVICRLDLEHTEVLGDTIEQIAFEKAGIIKPGHPVVLYGQEEAAEKVIIDICRERGCSLYITEPENAKCVYAGLDKQVVNYKKRENVETNLIGSYQTNNLLTVLDSTDVLRENGLDISEENVRYGLSNVRWPGRFQIIKTDPVLIVDGAHNPNGAASLAGCLSEYMPGEKFTFVCGVMADKDRDGMLEKIVPFANRFITVRPENTRALSAEELKSDIENKYHIEAVCAGSVADGCRIAEQYHNKGENVCIFGSLYQVGDVLDYFASASLASFER